MEFDYELVKIKVISQTTEISKINNLNYSELIFESEKGFDINKDLVVPILNPTINWDNILLVTKQLGKNKFKAISLAVANEPLFIPNYVRKIKTLI